jgi:hypothetical protein
MWGVRGRTEEYQSHDVLKKCPYFPCESYLTRKNQATMFLAPPHLYLLHSSSLVAPSFSFHPLTPRSSHRRLLLSTSKVTPVKGTRMHMNSYYTKIAKISRILARRARPTEKIKS